MTAWMTGSLDAFPAPARNGAARSSNNRKARGGGGDREERQREREFEPGVADNEDKRGQHADQPQRHDDQRQAVDDDVGDGVASAGLVKDSDVKKRDCRLDGDEDGGEEADGSLSFG